MSLSRGNGTEAAATERCPLTVLISIARHVRQCELRRACQGAGGGDGKKAIKATVQKRGPSTAKRNVSSVTDPGAMSSSTFYLTVRIPLPQDSEFVLDFEIESSKDNILGLLGCSLGSFRYAPTPGLDRRC